MFAAQQAAERDVAASLSPSTSPSPYRLCRGDRDGGAWGGYVRQNRFDCKDAIQIGAASDQNEQPSQNVVSKVLELNETRTHSNGDQPNSFGSMSSRMPSLASAASTANRWYAQEDHSLRETRVEELHSEISALEAANRQLQRDLNAARRDGADSNFVFQQEILAWQQEIGKRDHLVCRLQKQVC
jgi:hypothetical protein